MNKAKTIEQLEKTITAAREAIEAGEKMKAELLAVKEKDDWWTEYGFDKEPQEGDWVEVWDNEREKSSILRFKGLCDNARYRFRTGFDNYSSIAPAKLPREKLGLFVSCVMGHSGRYVYLSNEPSIEHTHDSVTFHSNPIFVRPGTELYKLTSHLKPGEKTEI